MSVSKFIKKFVPESVVQRVRNAILFRAEDPYNLHQVTPPTFSNVGVERIKGSRYPSPGSRGVEVSVPVKRDMNEDDIYHNNYFIRDPRNMKRNGYVSWNTSNGGLEYSTDDPHAPTHGKRKITLLPYDPTGTRTTKTVTYEAVAPILERHMPDHLPAPEWWPEREAIQAERERKGLPPAMGKRYNAQMSQNYNQVRW